MGHAVTQWLRHCAINRKVAGSIPDGVTGFFHWHNLSGRTMALGSTQPLTEMSTRNISCGVKAVGSVGLTNLQLDLLITLYNLTMRHWTCLLCYTLDDRPLDLIICYTFWKYVTEHVDYVILFNDTPMDMVTMLSNLKITPANIHNMLSNPVLRHCTWQYSVFQKEFYNFEIPPDDGQ
jgi:hypothetical protein